MRNEERDVYVIPPNFIEGGTLLGEMFKTRNVIEAGVLGLLVGLPVLNLGISLTTRVIILCLTALPLVLVALIGIAGSSLSAFILQFFRFLRNRRILTREPQKDNGDPKKSILPNWLRKRRPGQENKEREPMPASRSSLRFDRKERKVTQHKTFLPTEDKVRPLNPLTSSSSSPTTPRARRASGWPRRTASTLCWKRATTLTIPLTIPRASATSPSILTAMPGTWKS